MLDLIIIGSGPAGLTAAIYAMRAKLDTLVIEQNFMSGGQVINTYEIENYPALPGISGMDLSIKMREHAESLGAAFVTETVTKLALGGNIKTVITDKNVYEAKTVILAMGATHRKLGVRGEDELAGLGVSYCATCDGAFYKGSDVAVIGGGDVAVEDAIYLARICRKVYVIHRRDELRAAKALQDHLLSLENVEMVWDSVTDALEGENQVGAVRIHNVKTEESRCLHIDGVFIAVGIEPNTSLVEEQIELSRNGYILAGENCESSVEGVYAVGDIRMKPLRQIITACADGANAVASAQAYLMRN